MGLKLKGCAAIKVESYYPFKYAKGSTVYSCQTARKKGKLEKVTVKRVYLHLKGGVPVIMYLDTTNELWMENELCTHQEVLDLATKYLEHEIYLINQKECTQLYTQG